MKKIFTLIIMIFFFSAMIGNAQEIDKKNDKKIEYRRSSLHMILLESDRFPMKDTVMQAYYEMPFPDKYNDHRVLQKSIDPKNYVITDEDRTTAGMKIQGNGGKLFRGMVSEVTNGFVDTTAKDIPLQIEKYIKDSQLAKHLIAKWFNRSEDGKFNMDLIQERGFYDATAMDAEISSGQVRGSATLGDAGEELIKNTFVVFSRLNFMANEPIAKATQLIAIKLAEQIPNAIAQKVAIAGANLAYEKAKDGYSVFTTSWLYQLQWNDSIATIFYENMWNNKEAFDTSMTLFNLELVGVEKSRGIVVFSGKQKASQDQIVKLATIRNIDNTFAKLQKEYEVFKPKVPVLSIDPITAQIGMKEGLEGGERFEALEFRFDKKTGKTEYKSVGTLTVVKKKVWDNRYNITDAPIIDESANVSSDESTDETTANADESEGDDKAKDKDKDKKKDKDDGAPINATVFKGPKNIQPGMLLRQLK